MPLQASLEPLRSRIVLVVQGFTDGFQSLRSVPGQTQGHEVRMLRSLVRLAGPKSDVIEGKMLVDGIAVYHGAQPAVTHRESLFEEGGRPVIMQDHIPLRRTRAGRHKEQKRKDALHHSTGLFSIGQPVIVETTGMRE